MVGSVECSSGGGGGGVADASGSSCFVSLSTERSSSVGVPSLDNDSVTLTAGSSSVSGIASF